jgi:hypothetical protein
MSIVNEVSSAIAEKDKNNGDEMTKDMKRFSERKDKIDNLERRLSDLAHACRDLHTLENELGINLERVKKEIVNTVEKALNGQ